MTRLWCLCVAILPGLLATACLAAEESPMLEFDKLPATAKASGVTVTPTPIGGRTAFELATRHDTPWPGITIPAPHGEWDLSANVDVAVDVTNLGTESVKVALRLDNRGADGQHNCITGNVDVPSGETKTLRIPLPHLAVVPGVKLFGMRGYPILGDATEQRLDPAHVVGVVIFVPQPTIDHRFRVSNLRGEGHREPPKAVPAEQFMPFIDTFGQYVHRDWPGKTHSVAELRARAEAEAKELAADKGPDGWDQYGGWADGPKREATGHFRVEQVDGRWWLVDPEGHLFWSHGVDCVRNEDYTPTDERAAWFQDFPGTDPALAKFVGKGRALHGHYAGKTVAAYNFSAANTERKYGENAATKFADVTHQRLRAWGVNTIANWSEPAIYKLDRTPFVITLGTSAPNIEGSQGYWGKFKDVFHPEFREGIRKRVTEVAKTADEPWCLGIFVDNELGWGDETSLALGALKSPAEQPAKLAMVADLKAKYASIAELNAAWGTTYASWEALLADRTGPDPKRAAADLKAFYARIAEMYFQTIGDAIHELAPHTLYLGCRFAWANDVCIRAAAKHCDVVSFNLYRRSIADFKLPDGLDKPLIVGEFHFGALDRGMFHTGLVPTESQEERAATYRSYVEGALRNRLFVGTHWFKYQDEPATGRVLDEENYQIGFIDIAGTPYAETIAAVRQIGREMYRLRSQAPLGGK